ncbi:hypothetical protein [Xenorhabdus bovienii]|uniref:hypothetical protein n=1 Tax=Xenorhabdus bovienii TaxID=40576 RepID=UPI003DA1D25D
MNNQLPVKDITYGTKRYNDRVYKTAIVSLTPVIKGSSSVIVTKIDGESFVGNITKTNNRNGVIVFSDRRMLFAEIATIEVITRQEFPVLPTETIFFDKSTLPAPKSFHLILNKAHAVKKDVAVFMKNGEIYKGKSTTHDYDSLRLVTHDNRNIHIMYDAVKRIVPLEADGSLAE